MNQANDDSQDSGSKSKDNGPSDDVSNVSSSPLPPIIDLSQQPSQHYYLSLQRKQRLEALVSKRKGNLGYMKEVQLGNRFWLNCVRLTPIDINKHINAVWTPAKTQSLFYLGMGIAKLLDQSNEVADSSTSSAYHVSRSSQRPDHRASLVSGLGFVRAISQLLEEWDYFTAGSAIQGVKYMLAKNSPCIYPQFQQPAAGASSSSSSSSMHSALTADIMGAADSSVGSSSSQRSPEDDASLTHNLSPSDHLEPASSTSAKNSGVAVQQHQPQQTDAAVKPTLYKFNSNIVYEHLPTHPLPFELDFVEVSVPLAETLVKMYGRFLHEDCFGYGTSF